MPLLTCRLPRHGVIATGAWNLSGVVCRDCAGARTAPTQVPGPDAKGTESRSSMGGTGPPLRLLDWDIERQVGQRVEDGIERSPGYHRGRGGPAVPGDPKPPRLLTARHIRPSTPTGRAARPG